jgi:uncharacterized membrane protein
MITVTLYRRTDCPACDQAVADLAALQAEIPHRLVLIDLDEKPGLKDTFGSQLPVIEVGPYRLLAPFTKQDLVIAIGAARDRHNHMEAVGDQTYQERLKKGHTLTRTDRFSNWFVNHYMLVFNLIFLVYVGLPFLAPVFMKAGAETPARLIYKIYSPLCHQLAFRSWFLFGEQLFYPRELAGMDSVASYEETTGLSSLDVQAARRFIGDEHTGYKVALCERDIAIYSSIVAFGILFSITGKRLKSIPWYLWILIGIIPIAVDGFSQLSSLMNLPFSLPERESTPVLRTLTGFLFGFTTVWYGYPYVEDTMAETRKVLARKFAVVNMDKKGSILQ